MIPGMDDGKHPAYPLRGHVISNSGLRRATGETSFARVAPISVIFEIDSNLLSVGAGFFMLPALYCLLTQTKTGYNEMTLAFFINAIHFFSYRAYELMLISTRLRMRCVQNLLLQLWNYPRRVRLWVVGKINTSSG